MTSWPTATAVLAFALAHFPATSAADPATRQMTPVAKWITLGGCRLEDNNFNDGDSFHVTQGGKQYLFRLCYVDTPETTAHRELVERTSDQARYWNIYKRDLHLLADEASAFTHAKLSRPFTVMTRWDDAKGASQMPRYFAVVRTADGEDLAEALVGAGFARVFGFSPDLPGNQSSHSVWKKLEGIEAKAKAAGAGAWGFAKGSGKNSKPAAKSPPLQKGKPTPTPARTRSLGDIPAY